MLGNIFETRLWSCVRGNIECVVSDADYGADFQHCEELSDLGNRPCLFDAELEGVGRCSGKRKKIKPFWEWKERSTKLKIEVERVVQNLLVGLEELDWSANCGLTCKLTYVGRNVWAYKYKPRPKSLFKSKSKLGLDSKKKLASMMGLDVGPG